MGAPKTIEIPAHQVRPGNIARFKAGAQLPDYLTVTSVEPVREADGTVKVETRDGKLVPAKVEITGTGHGAKWADNDQKFSMVVMGDLAVSVRLKRTRVVYLRTGEVLEFVRRPNIRAAAWVRAKDANGNIRTVFLNEILRREWEYRPIV